MVNFHFDFDVFFFFPWMFRWLIIWGFLALVGFASSLGQVSWFCLAQCIGFSFLFFKHISMPSLLVFNFLLPFFTKARSRSLSILFVLCRICSSPLDILMALLSPSKWWYLKFCISSFLWNYETREMLASSNEIFNILF